MSKNLGEEDLVIRNNGCSGPENQYFSSGRLSEKEEITHMYREFYRRAAIHREQLAFNKIVYYVIIYRPWPFTRPVPLFCCIEAEESMCKRPRIAPIPSLLPRCIQSSCFTLAYRALRRHSHLLPSQVSTILTGGRLS